MLEHKFAVGEMVRFTAASELRQLVFPSGEYRITRTLPENRGEFEYRIQNVDGSPEIVALESELSRVA
jgi:hypothetical protein